MSSSASPPASPSTSHSKKAIISGVIGGTAFLIFILAAIFIPISRQRISCYDIALQRHTQTHTRNTTTATHIRKDSMQEEKIVLQEDMESRGLGSSVNRRQNDEEEMLALEEMVGLEEMLRIEFPDPERYELDGGSVIEGRANWEIKL